MKNSRLFKWSLVSALSSALVVLVSGSALAATGGDFWVSDITNAPPKSTLRMVWKDATIDGVFFSTDPRNKENSESNRAQISNGFKTVLGVCGSSLEPGCISAVEFKSGDTWKKAVLQPSPGQRNYAFGTISPDMKWDIAKSSLYDADAYAGIFKASEPNLFEFPGAPNRLGEKYWVNAVVTSVMRSGFATITGLDISAWGVGIGSSCPDADKVEGDKGTYCNTLVNLPKDLEIKVSVYLGSRISELSGWFDGRMLNPSIDFGVENPGYVTVIGSPVEVSTAVTSFIAKGDPLYDVSSQVEQMQGNQGEPRQALGRLDGIQNWNKYASKIVETAAATNTYWRLSSWLDGSQNQYSCPNVTGVKGVVLTNAAAYTPSAPAWNRSTGALDFEVASTHLKANGEANEGFYDLLLNDKIAKCIWGAGVTGGKASISVINADGTPQVATTTFAISGGWAKFKAYGYHYSKPQISVKLVQPPSKSKTSTITCIKGKLTKKVTAVAPKCPTGYKKKA
jgi:hypothetical protein